MKYVVFKREHRGVVRELPVLFPEALVHAEVAKWLTSARGPLAGYSAVSAGFLSSLNVPAECHGKSDSLGLVSRGDEDSRLIAVVDYTHGIVA